MVEFSQELANNEEEQEGEEEEESCVVRMMTAVKKKPTIIWLLTILVSKVRRMIVPVGYWGSGEISLTIRPKQPQ